MSNEDDKILVVVYGTLKKHKSNHRLMADSKFLGHTDVKGTMYSLGMFPAVALEGEYTIKGEVYEVDQHTLTRLDGLEGYPDFYDRALVPTPYGPSWIYTMPKEQLEDYQVIKSGCW
jgi:gamma-glutamylcyclotransferase (GGCT)/AIG2-like uncharacterized protein YtfP